MVLSILLRWGSWMPCFGGDAAVFRSSLRPKATPAARAEVGHGRLELNMAWNRDPDLSRKRRAAMGTLRPCHPEEREKNIVDGVNQEEPSDHIHDRRTEGRYPEFFWATRAEGEPAPCGERDGDECGVHEALVPAKPAEHFHFFRELFARLLAL
jgi:hypothetical protein